MEIKRYYKIRKADCQEDKEYLDKGRLDMIKKVTYRAVGIGFEKVSRLLRRNADWDAQNRDDGE